VFSKKCQKTSGGGIFFDSHYSSYYNIFSSNLVSIIRKSTVHHIENRQQNSTNIQCSVCLPFCSLVNSTKKWMKTIDTEKFHGLKGDCRTWNFSPSNLCAMHCSSFTVDRQNCARDVRNDCLSEPWQLVTVIPEPHDSQGGTNLCLINPQPDTSLHCYLLEKNASCCNCTRVVQ